MRGSHLVWLRNLVLLAGAAAASGQEPTPVPEVQKLEFHLAEQPLGQALTALALQSGLTVVMESSVARGVIAPALEGQYSPAEAIRRILGPTGLHAQYLDKRTVVVLATRADTHGSAKSADFDAAHSIDNTKAADATRKEPTQEPASGPAPRPAA